jgi:hypothetical protein
MGLLPALAPNTELEPYLYLYFVVFSILFLSGEGLQQAVGAGAPGEAAGGTDGS